MYLENKITDFIKVVKPAKEIATKAHKGVYRRGKDEDGNKVEYITHPEAVVDIVRKVKESKYISALVAASLLHDVPEDTKITLDDIRKFYGDSVLDIKTEDIDQDNIIELVLSLIGELTSDEEEIKKMGKTEYLSKKMLHMSSWALVIKLADRLHNVTDVRDKLEGSPSDVRWAKKYAKQTKNIIDTLKRGRKLSKPQLELIDLIMERINPALD